VFVTIAVIMHDSDWSTCIAALFLTCRKDVHGSAAAGVAAIVLTADLVTVTVAVPFGAGHAAGTERPPGCKQAERST